MKFWKKLSHAEMDTIITKALSENIDYKNKISLGIPASTLDPKVFYDNASFLKDAPLLRAFVRNPNHIGCHTLSDSELFFKGTQEIEKQLIETLCVDFFKATTNTCDGYVAAGGTEANLQAIWIYRNYFSQEFNAKYNEIAILCSEDTHYSVVKASNLLNIPLIQITVHQETRVIQQEALENAVQAAMQDCIKYFAVVSNMGTTMFGSVDDPDLYAQVLIASQAQFKIHIDGAFGGFIFPTSSPNSNIGFHNPHISSITLDAHKMLQAPYGTGIFLSRKGLMQYVFTKEASYVNGMDITLSGSRSGANAIAVWMILFTYGPYGWMEKINKLLYRTDWLCKALDELNFRYYRHPQMNIVTINAKDICVEVAAQHGLVPDTHGEHPNWLKVVVMDHVEIDFLEDFINDLKVKCVEKR